MDNQRLEARVQAIAEACLAGREIEDDRVELKAVWPDKHYKTARQIAAHANASRGETILWVIGLDERRKSIQDVSGTEVANWWPTIETIFDGNAPGIRTLVVHVGEGRYVTVLEFDTSRVPYLVKTEGDGAVSRELPWRGANGTRSAYRHEVLSSIVEQSQAPELELVGGSLAAVEDKDRPGREARGTGFQLQGQLIVYVSALSTAMLPQHRQRWAVTAGSKGSWTMSARVSPPYRLGGYTQSGGRAREPVGHIEVLDTNGMFVHKPGEISVWLDCPLTDREADDLRFAPRIHLDVSLPVDRSTKASHLACDLHLVVGSEETWNPDGFQAHRTMARFEIARDAASS